MDQKQKASDTVPTSEKMRKIANSELNIINSKSNKKYQNISGSDLNLLKRPIHRRIISYFYRIIKIFVRPIVFRWRLYLNGPIIDRIEILQNKINQQCDHVSFVLMQLARNDGKQFPENFKTLQDHTDQEQMRLEFRLSRLEEITNEAARRFAVYTGSNKVMVLTRVGYVMCAANDTAIVANLVDSGDLERGTRLLIERLVRPGDHFVDIGANVGMHTLAAARALKGQGRIWAFEPFQSTRSLLSETVLINGYGHLVDVHEAAISTQSGSSQLHLGKLSGHHSLYPLENHDASEAGAVTVKLLRLADVISENSRVDFIKIDVEGAELDVLASANGLIANNPEIAIIVEFGPSHLKRTGVTQQNWFAAFTQLGLSFRLIDDLTGELSTQSIQEISELASCNLLFARPSAGVWRRACTKA